MNWSFIGFGIAAVMAVGAVDYIQQSRAIGVDIGAMSLSGYVENLQNRHNPAFDAEAAFAKSSDSEGVIDKDLNGANVADADLDLGALAAMPVSSVVKYVIGSGDESGSTVQPTAPGETPSVRKAAGVAEAGKTPLANQGEYGLKSLVYKGAKTRKTKLSGPKRIEARTFEESRFNLSGNASAAAGCTSIDGAKRCLVGSN